MKKKIVQMQNNLNGNKVFLNMVVHDMRNPTSQIEFTLKQSLEHLTNMKKKLDSLDYSLTNLDFEEIHQQRNRRRAYS